MEVKTKIILINGKNPFNPIRTENGNIRYPTFKLKYTFNECCTSNKDFMIFEDLHTKEKKYYLIGSKGKLSKDKVKKLNEIKFNQNNSTTENE